MPCGSSAAPEKFGLFALGAVGSSTPTALPHFLRVTPQWSWKVGECNVVGNKKEKSKPLKRWLTAKDDQRETRFIQVGNSLIFNEHYKALSVGARYFYLLCAMEAGGNRFFQFPASKMKAMGIPTRTARNYVEELKAAGFIECTQNGKCTRQPNDYQFSFRWLEPP